VSRVESSRAVLAGGLLSAIREALGSLPDSPQKRQLGAKAESYARTIEGWRLAPPSPDRRDALYDMVLALHAKLLEVMRRESLDLTPAGLRPQDDDEEHEDPPPSSTPIARVSLRAPKARV
jgi:hypothetical protein